MKCYPARLIPSRKAGLDYLEIVESIGQEMMPRHRLWSKAFSGGAETRLQIALY